MEETYVKDYFSRMGTVSSWWEPETGDKSHIFAREIKILEKMLDGEKATGALDIACGKGRVSRMLNQRRLKTISLDISQEMLDIGYQRGDITKMHRGDGEDLHFDDESFDVVTCIDALVHFPNYKKAISEAHRVLRPNGVYLCTTSNPYDLGFIPRTISKGIRAIFNGESSNKGEGIFRYIAPSEMRRVLTTQGFQVEEETRLGVLAPVKIKSKNGKDFYLISGSFSKRYDNLDRLLENLPVINKLAILSVYKARK
jgi:2-polyprenyl-6-hydroxyphenyl methylase/3-demethylubiquinone-9 3-methyltransferase